MMNIRNPILITTGLFFLCSCLSQDQLKLSYEGYTPLVLDDGWLISTPEAQGMNKEILDQAYRSIYYEDTYPGARALLVIRNGKLVAEAYPRNKDHINQINNVQSITKAFVSILTGIAVDLGDLASIDTPLFDLFPLHFDSNQDKHSMTLKHALTMTTGLDFDDGNFLDFYNHEGVATEFVLSRPLLSLPGELFQYSDGPPQLVVQAIEQSTAQSFEDYADTHLFAPLGITNYQWEQARDGVQFGAFGLFLTARDLARFGQLLLDDGMWNSQQLVSQAWLQQATRIRPELQGGGGQYFGYYLWINPANGSFSARGNGGQFVYVVPDRELIIVYTASPSISNILNHEQNLINTVINSTY